MKTKGICIFWCLIFWGVLFFGAFPASPAESDFSGGLNRSLDLGPGLKAFRSGDYSRAYELLLNAFEIDPGDFWINFYLGRAAFEVGDYEMAVMVFERAIMLRPQDPRSKLEMARAYQKLGLNDMARKYCREVLLTDPPLTVKKNIERFLAYIDRTEKRHFFSGSLALGFDWSDNVWSSPSDMIIDTILGSVSLTGPSSRQKDDFIYSALAEINHSYSFPGTSFSWQSRLTGYGGLYQEEKGLDTLYLGIESGPERSLGKGVAGLCLVADYLELGGSTYSESAGAKIFYRHMLNPSLAVSPSLLYQDRSYKDSSARDGSTWRCEVETVVRFQRLWLDSILGYEQKNATDDEYGYDQYDFQLSISREFDRGITLTGSYEYSYADYRGTAYLFDKPRREQVHSVGFGIKKRLWQSPDRMKGLLVRIGYGYTRAEANLDLYGYSKNEIRSAVEYHF